MRVGVGEEHDGRRGEQELISLFSFSYLSPMSDLPRRPGTRITADFPLIASVISLLVQTMRHTAATIAI